MPPHVSYRRTNSHQLGRGRQEEADPGAWEVVWTKIWCPTSGLSPAEDGSFYCQALGKFWRLCMPAPRTLGAHRDTRVPSLPAPSALRTVTEVHRQLHVWKLSSRKKAQPSTISGARSFLLQADLGGPSRTCSQLPHLTETPSELAGNQVQLSLQCVYPHKAQHRHTGG